MLLVCLLAEALLGSWIAYKTAAEGLRDRIRELGSGPEHVTALISSVKQQQINELERLSANLMLLPEITEIEVFDKDETSLVNHRAEGAWRARQSLAFSLAPAGSETSDLGKVVFTYQLDTLQQRHAEDLRVRLIVLVVLLALICGASEIAFRGTIDKPLVRLRQAILETRLSGVKNRVLWSTDDEMGLLAEEYNLLLDTQEETEDKLNRSREAAEQAAVAKGAFLANMSHEIRTPMNGVMGMVELLRRTELSREQREYTDTIHGSTVALLEIIDDILDLSKIEAGKFRIENVPFDLEKVMSELLALLVGKARAQGLALHLRYTGDSLPTFKGDPGRIRQILLNYASNALKFTESGHILFSVDHERIDDERSTIGIAVTDTGIGIPPEKLGGIFDAFTQVDSGSTRRFSGTGLGLSICRKLSELMGGRVAVTSRPGSGSTFSFSLEVGAVPGTHPVEWEDELPCLHGRRVLVVEPDSVGREISLEKLERWGAEVSGHPTGEDALAALDADRVEGRKADLILIEKELGDMDAMGFAAQLEASGFVKPRTAVFTALPDSEEDKVFREMGFQGYLSRPAQRYTLARFLESLMTGKSDFVSRGTLAEHDSRKDTKPLERFDVKILVVDDNVVNQRVVSRMLQKLGCNIVVANNGNEAISQWRQESPDLILMDCHMPELDGLQATRHIREREGGPDTPIIALSAGVLLEERERCYRAGMNDFLAKPVSISDLVGVLERYFQSV
ncbi:MAG: response regulator [Acidobacteriota bacterium]|nr:response regulator [Acidobacteriota bacterium]